MKKSEYAKYLQSEHWQTLRKEVIESTPFCDRCEVPRWLAGVAYDQDLHVHHLSYANLGNEDWLDLQVLCRHCHEVETFGSSDLRPIVSKRCESCGDKHWDRYAKMCQTCERVYDPPSLYELLELGTKDNPVIVTAIDAICLILHGHGMTAGSLGRYITKQFEKADKRAAQKTDDEVPF